ncbi:hypothetical protein LZC95_08435 [Pendulispora brunnea]|uniref:Uncharacterized protein n=1 Tax=Pendulispora brunnea TaxID=2905690 RepID=A0ABZ2KHR9_9BACT
MRESVYTFSTFWAVQVEAKDDVAEGLPVPKCVDVDDVTTSVVGDSFEHILSAATPPAMRDEGTARRVDSPKRDLRSFARGPHHSIGARIRVARKHVAFERNDEVVQLRTAPVELSKPLSPPPVENTFELGVDRNPARVLARHLLICLEELVVELCVHLESRERMCITLPIPKPAPRGLACPHPREEQERVPDALVRFDLFISHERANLDEFVGSAT